MYKITKESKNHFNENGWVLIHLNIEETQIMKCLEAVNRMRKKAIEIMYNPCRVYYDHLTNFNLAAIEAPFNSRICAKDIEEFFSQINLGSMVKDLMSWDDTYCSLARLFCMGNYNYRGKWHRDYSLPEKSTRLKSSLSRDYIQLNIYFDNQRGFRLLKNEYDFGGSQTLIPTITASNEIEKYHYPLSPPHRSYEILNGVPGSVLFFDPLRLHQGSSSSSRSDFHMRFLNPEKISPIENLLKNSFQDFDIYEHLHADCQIDKAISKLGQTGRQSIKRRALNTINTFTGIGNYYARYQQKKNLIESVLNFGSPDKNANTIFQKFDN
tara:strand:- start:70 stop:1044 length:975 start_codon:yes stop_codon:yes gene_type:complete